MKRPIKDPQGHAAQIIALAASVALAIGCGATTTSPSQTAASPSPTQSPTPTPGSSASVLSTQSLGTSPLALCAKDFNGCPVPAGTYSTAPFVHPFLVTIGAGWTNDRDWPHGGSLTSGSGGLLEWGSGFTGGTDPTGVPVTLKPTSDALLAYVRSVKGFTVAPEVPLTIGGKTGRSVDVSTNKTSADGLLDIPEDSYNLGSGEKVRLIVFDVSDPSPLMIMVEVPMANDFVAAIAAMQPVLHSIVWQ